MSCGHLASELSTFPLSDPFCLSVYFSFLCFYFIYLFSQPQGLLPGLSLPQE